MLEADYYWMYDDGWGGTHDDQRRLQPRHVRSAGATATSSCTIPQLPGRRAVLSMGAAFSSTGYAGGSIAAIFVSSCAPPTDITVTWGQVATQVHSGSTMVGIAR